MVDELVVNQKKTPRQTPRQIDRDFNVRLAASIKDRGPGFDDRIAISAKERERLSAISAHQRDSSGGGGLERVIAELKGAQRAAEQAQDEQANVEDLRNHAAQHARQAWLLLTGSVPERIWGRCDCAI